MGYVQTERNHDSSRVNHQPAPHFYNEIIRQIWTRNVLQIASFKRLETSKTGVKTFRSISFVAFVALSWEITSTMP